MIVYLVVVFGTVRGKHYTNQVKSHQSISFNLLFWLDKILMEFILLQLKIFFSLSSV